MSQSDVKNCPNTNTLADYLLGQLEPPTLDECESHIADCDTCHETLRGLSADDTLSEHVSGAFLGSDSFLMEAEDREQVHGLVDRLLKQTGSNAPPRSQGPKLTAPEAEVLADRAAEVLRCVTPPDDDQKTLGSIGDYQLMRLLGSGSTGVVFQAIDQKLDRTVALKVLRPSLGSVARERFIAEARLAASIEHPNVVTIYQIDQYDRLAFIAMQWLPGQTLEAKLNSTATMADEDVRRISAQVAAGLQAAHGRQLVHRDIKPANVWISDDDEVKILDFGLARIVDDDPGLTATGMLAGTPNFMSPEQTKGHELDGRSDLFSLGCMMYRMATGKLAFGATSILGTLQAIQNEQPTPPKLVNVDVSSDLSDLTMALLEKQPANRPESAAQVVTMLEAERGQWPMKIAGYQSPQPASQKELTSQAKRHRFGGRWATFIAASLLGFAGWYFAPQIIRIATDQGELVIESEDKDVEVQILQDGQVVRVLDTKTKNSFNIESGDYQIKAAGDGNSFEVTPGVLTMKRGQQTVVSVTKQPSTLEPKAPTAIIGYDNGQGFIPNSPSIEIDPQKPNDDVDGDAPTLKIYPITTDPQLALDALQMVLEGRDAVRMQQDQKTGAIIVMGRKADHQLVSETLATLGKDADTSAENKGETPSQMSAVMTELERRTLATRMQLEQAANELGSEHPVVEKKKREIQALRKQLNANQPMYKGKPFAHWINITKTERSEAMLCDALRAGAELAETAEDKAALLGVTRTLARKHGTARRENQYYQALSKAIHTLAPAEIFQFVLDELEHGTSQSVRFCSTLSLNDNVFVEQAPKLLKLVVAQIEGGGAGYNVLENVVDLLIGTRGSRASFASGGKRAYVSGVLEKRVLWANEKNPTLAPTIRQLFLDSSARTKLRLVQLTRAFWPNDEEIELALQSSLFDPSTDVELRDSLCTTIVGFGKRDAYWDFLNSSTKPIRDTYWGFLNSSPKPIAVQFLKKFLDNQLGPENQRIVVMDEAQYSKQDVEGRPATIFNILLSARVLRQQHPNDTDEDVRELLKRILEIETTDNPTLKQELDDFKALKIFPIAKTLLEKITKQPATSTNP